MKQHLGKEGGWPRELTVACVSGKEKQKKTYRRRGIEAQGFVSQSKRQGQVCEKPRRWMSFSAKH